MFSHLQFNEEDAVYVQLAEYTKELILKGFLQKNEKLPSTRELSALLNISRNTVMLAYQTLEAEGLIQITKGKGAFISQGLPSSFNTKSLHLNWEKQINAYARLAEDLDITKHEKKWEKNMISFTSISPDEKLFDLENLKRSFLNKLSIEEGKLLNYGYAKGYQPLIAYLSDYMKYKGIQMEGKDILIANGFTEGFDIVLSALMEKGDEILCENPTHNTALKIMGLHGLTITGIPMKQDGLDTEALKKQLLKSTPKLAYLIPSYHNPTGVVMHPQKRMEVFQILSNHSIPIVEDGFNEELRYSSSHLFPLLSLCGKGNNVIYIGSFSKILFPGIRIGWIVADKRLISYLESIKRSRNIHTSFLDQGILLAYLQEGHFEKYLKKVRKIYRERFDFALQYAKEQIPHKKIWGERGMHMFIELDALSSRDLLDVCYKKGVIFTPGDIFYTDDQGKNTFRLGLSRVNEEEIQIGFKIIGETIKEMEERK